MTMALADGTRLAGEIRRLREAYLASDAVHGQSGRLDAAVCDATKALFLACRDTPSLLDDLRRLAPQYGKPEYLLPVNAAGVPLAVDQAALKDCYRVATAYPEFALWIQPAALPSASSRSAPSQVVSGTRGLSDRPEPPDWAKQASASPRAQQAASPPAMLFARWLCHLAGLRHRTVELFLDHPQAPGYTLVQLRSPAKLEYPGCFDLPCAGHVAGLASVEEGLFQELAEELGLAADDLSGLQRLGAYEHAESHPDRAVLDVEHRTVFRARWQPGALDRIRFADGEVAAIAVFGVEDLRSTITREPERFASGLRASLAFYLTR
jgi:isopentenyldiphosphate isomerase